MTHYIGITGSHSTGKSTFLDLVQHELEGANLRIRRVADKASDCREAGFRILQNHTFESTLWIMVSVIRGELEAGLSADIVLVDRPVFDALGYLEGALETQRRNISIVEREYLYTLARLHAKRYAIIFRTKLVAEIPLGEGRDKDLPFRDLVDKKIANVLKELNIGNHVLDNTNSNMGLKLVRKLGIQKAQDDS